LRRLPEAAEGADEDPRPARRRGAAAAPARRRRRESATDAGDPGRDRAAGATGGGCVTTFMGVDHVGVGVGDVDEAIDFYGRHVGFDSVLFDYTGELPGLDAIVGGTPVARVAMVASRHATPIGPGRLKLVQVLDGDGPSGPPAGQAWGEVGVCEICLHVRGVEAVHERLVAAGCSSLMEPI